MFLIHNRWSVRKGAQNSRDKWDRLGTWTLVLPTGVLHQNEDTWHLEIGRCWNKQQNWGDPMWANKRIQADRGRTRRCVCGHKHLSHGVQRSYTMPASQARGELESSLGWHRVEKSSPMGQDRCPGSTVGYKIGSLTIWARLSFILSILIKHSLYVMHCSQY